MLFSLASYVVPGVFAATKSSNVTIDDDDASIVYSPAAAWGSSSPSNSLDYGGFHHLSSDVGATAKFTFNGTAVYIMAPLWPYAVGATVSVDGSVPEDVSMVDTSHTATEGPETVQSAVVWGRNGLSNGTHTLTVGFNTKMRFLALDGIIYTVADTVVDPSSSSTTLPVTALPASAESHSSMSSTTSSSAGLASAAAAASQSASTGDKSTLSSSKTRAMIIAISVTMCLVFILVLIGLFIYKRRQQRSHAEWLRRQSVLAGRTPAPYATTFEGKLPYGDLTSTRLNTTRPVFLTSLTIPPEEAASAAGEPEVILSPNRYAGVASTAYRTVGSTAHSEEGSQVDHWDASPPPESGHPQEKEALHAAGSELAYLDSFPSPPSVSSYPPEKERPHSTGSQLEHPPVTSTHYPWEKESLRIPHPYAETKSTHLGVPSSVAAARSNRPLPPPPQYDNVPGSSDYLVSPEKNSPVPTHRQQPSMTEADKPRFVIRNK